MPPRRPATNKRPPSKRSKPTTTGQPPPSYAAPPVNSFAKLPAEILYMIFTDISPKTIDLHRWILVDKWMYEAFVLQLYRALKINASTAGSIFKGINYSLEEEDGVVNEGSGESRGEEEGSKNGRNMRKERTESAGKLQSNDAGTAFGLDPLSINLRKIRALQQTETLIITDWDGAKAVAMALGQKDQGRSLEEEFSRKWRKAKENAYKTWYRIPEGSISLGDEMFWNGIAKIFQEVNKVSFASKLLCSKDFWPFNW
ncbi:hypothetical protein I317_01274 [Kwoniella heveanensis CBS 569]|nr:hypothetical protein I317_01274 [Kwoniella heveanensis CBS 569]